MKNGLLHLICMRRSIQEQSFQLSNCLKFKVFYIAIILFLCAVNATALAQSMYISKINNESDETKLQGYRLDEQGINEVRVDGYFDKLVINNPNFIEMYINGTLVACTMGSTCGFNKNVTPATFYYYFNKSNYPPCQKLSIQVRLCNWLTTPFPPHCVWYATEKLEVFRVISNDVDINDCVPEPDNCMQEDSKQSPGFPVNVVTGKMWYKTADITMEGNVPLSFVRYYDNKTAYNVDLGYGWRHNFSHYIDLTDLTKIRYYDGNGLKIIYSGTPDRDWTHRTRLTKPNYYQVDTFDNTKYRFNATTGKLYEIELANGDKYTIARDGNNRITTVTNAIGWSLSFSYSGTDLKIQSITTNPGAAIISFSYTGDNLTGYTDAEGKVWTYQYNDVNDTHNLTAVVDPLNHVIEQHTYYANDKAQTSSREGGHELLTFVYGSGQTTTTNSMSVVTTYNWDAVKKVVTAISGPGCGCSGGESRSFTWSNTLLKLTDTDGRGIVTQYDWYYVRYPDPTWGQIVPTRNLSKVAEAIGTADARETIFSEYYDLNPNVNLDEVRRGIWNKKEETSVDTPANDIITTRQFDTARNLTQRAITGYVEGISETHTETWTYGTHGKMLSCDGPRTDVSDVTNYVYYADKDPGNQPWSKGAQMNTVTNAKSHVTTYGDYHFTGQPLSITDPNTVVEEFSYNNRGQTLSRTLHAESDQVTQYVYYNDGLLDYIVYPEGNVTDYTYNAQHKITEEEEKPNLTTSFHRAHNEYDTEDNRIKEEYYEWNGSSWDKRKQTDFAYDDYNRLSRIINYDATFTEYWYDVAGNLLYKDDANHPYPGTGNHYITYTYDNLNRKTQEQIIVGGVAAITQNQYDTLDNLIQITDAEDHATTFEFDDFSRLEETVSPDSGTSTFIYDLAGNNLTETDAEGIMTNRTYDELNRQILVAYPDRYHNVGLQYDSANQNYGKGRLTQATECPNCRFPRRTKFNYYKSGLLQDEEINRGQTTTYQYNRNGNLTAMTYPSGRLVTYNVDPTTGKPSAIGAVINGSSTPILSNISYYPFGPVKTATYGNGLQLTRNYDLKYRMILNSVGTSFSVNYTYDNETNITDISGSYAREYAYDDAYRLITALGDWGTKEYSYDDNGNRLTKVLNGNTTTYTYQASTNKLVQTTGYEPDAFTYNNRGDITSDTYYNYEYGDNKRLISIIDTSSGQQTKAYFYDYRLRRIRAAEISWGWNYFYSKDDTLINEVDDLGYTKDYIYLGMEPIAKIEYNWGVDHLYYYHNDHLMTPLFMTDDSQSTVWAGTYYPFGKLYSEQLGVTNNLRFPGQYDERISNTYLYYNWNRFYAPVIGRYFQTDPIGLAGGINLYAYAANNPVNFIDPSGLTLRSNWKFFWDWALGRGGKGGNNRHYGRHTTETMEMRKSKGVQDMRNNYMKSGCRNMDTTIYPTFDAFWDTLANPYTADWSSTATQVGGLQMKIKNNGNGTSTYTITNEVGTHSAFYHIFPNRTSSTGPMRTIIQTFEWTEYTQCSSRASGGCH